MSKSYLSKQVNGYNTRNNFVRSMDLMHCPTSELSREAFKNTWFASNKKHYLMNVWDLVRTNNHVFWPKRAFTEVLDEIFIDNSDMNDEKKMAQDVDILKSKFMIWSSKRKSQPVTDDDMRRAIRSFEAKYVYACPDSFMFYWVNNGAYITLMYGIKFEGLCFPGMNSDESFSKLKAMALEVLEDHDHDQDWRLFDIVHFLYSSRMKQLP